MSSESRLRRRAQRGFTLVELMISLVMGLVVAMAAVGLSRTATTTFHESARSSVTEMAVRMASERLRQDLTRISYMSTGNIQLDPKVARRPGVTGGAVARYVDPGMMQLRGMKINVEDGINATSTVNQLKPDSIDIAGNLATDDQYSGTIYTGDCGQVVRLDPMADAAVWALAAGAPNDELGKFTANAKMAFLPTDDGKLYLAQVTDAMGCTHYAPVCSVSLVNGSTGTSKYLLVGISAGAQNDTGNPLRGVLYANSSDSAPLLNNCGSSEMGKVSIAPIARVRWSLALNTQPALEADTQFEPTGNKYNIVRQRFDWTGSGDPISTEIIAEYGVDLKFGITYLDLTKPVNTDRTGVADLDTGGAVIRTVTNNGDTLPGTPGPQHVRSVRYRVAVRTSVPDREQNITVAPVPYISRYCADGSSAATCKRWSRVRTIVSEVALMNQSRMTW